MTRRPAKRRTATPTTRLAFEDKHREIFRLAGDDWTPPAEIMVRHGKRSWTLTARYKLPDGQPAVLTTRLTKTASGVVRADEGMKLVFTVRGRA